MSFCYHTVLLVIYLFYYLCSTVLQKLICKALATSYLNSNVSFQPSLPKCPSKCISHPCVFTVLLLALPSTLHCLLLVLTFLTPVWQCVLLPSLSFLRVAGDGILLFSYLFPKPYSSCYLCKTQNSASASRATRGYHPVKAKLLVMYSSETLLTFVRLIYSWNLHWIISWMLLFETC